MALICPSCFCRVERVRRDEEETEFRVEQKEEPVLRVYLERYFAFPCGHEVVIEFLDDRWILHKPS